MNLSTITAFMHRICWVWCAALAQATWNDGSSRCFVGLCGLARR